MESMLRVRMLSKGNITRSIIEQRIAQANSTRAQKHQLQDLNPGMDVDILDDVVMCCVMEQLGACGRSYKRECRRAVRNPFGRPSGRWRRRQWPSRAPDSVRFPMSGTRLRSSEARALEPPKGGLGAFPCHVLCLGVRVRGLAVTRHHRGHNATRPCPADR